MGKGLEFDMFIPPFSQGFPTKSALYQHRILEEEKVALLAMTRTKLFLSRYRSTERYPWSGFWMNALTLILKAIFLKSSSLYCASKTSPSFPSPCHKLLSSCLHAVWIIAFLFNVTEIMDSSMPAEEGNRMYRLPPL